MAAIKMWTPRINQGQTVVISYGWLDGNLYRSIVDRSARVGEQERWEVARDSVALRAYQEEIDDYETPPAKITWRKCVSPETCYCHGCGEKASRSSVVHRNGNPYCAGCEAAESE